VAGGETAVWALNFGRNTPSCKTIFTAELIIFEDMIVKDTVKYFDAILEYAFCEIDKARRKLAFDTISQNIDTRIAVSILTLFLT
jgi:hypothetical protein